MRVVFAPDKFKGTLSAAEAAAAMAAGWRSARPDDTLVIQPVADGGEGTAELVCAARNGQWVQISAHDPLSRQIMANYGLVEIDGARTAFVACNAASGYTLVRPEERDLPNSSTFGTGELLAHAFAAQDVHRVVVSLGGSATNDAGSGLAAALGYRFLDSAGRDLPPGPAALARLQEVVPPAARPWREIPVTAACDVRNPLLGPRGATRVYGPQKGLRQEDTERIESALQRLADVAATSLGVDFRDTPGAGAAGGLGFGLLTFCAARLAPGFGLVSDLIGLETILAAADLVITGEGAADAQSLEGKAPAGVATMARRLGKPVIVIAGMIPPEEAAAVHDHFDAAFAMADGRRPLARCLNQPTEALAETTAEVARGEFVRRLSNSAPERSSNL